MAPAAGRGRRAAWGAAALLLGAGGLVLGGGTASPTGPADPPAPLPALADTWTVWPVTEGLRAPRCIRVDAARGRVYVLGTDGALHVFGRDGGRVHQARLPLTRDGNPQGLAVDRDGNLLVADTHASRVLRLAPDGALLATYGRPGEGPGEFAWPTGVCEARDGTLWVTEYGTQDRLQALAPDGTSLRVVGRTGRAPGEFYRPSDVAEAQDGALWVADACNHRLQAFAPDGTWRACHDGTGHGGCAFRHPYDLAFAPDGRCAVVEYAACRVRLFDPAGGPAEFAGQPGRGVGELCGPWGVAVDAAGLLVADTGNHRWCVRAAPPPRGTVVERRP